MTGPGPDHRRALFDAAMSLPPDQRRDFIEVNTPGDPALRTELQAMLDAGESGEPVATALLSTPVTTLGPDTGTGMPAQIGNYRLLRELGRGGMGVVYLAVRNDDVFRKVVALKVTSAEAIQGEFLDRFRLERQILAGLDHPNIARILDGGDTGDGRPFYVMEYVAGFPIDEYCRRVDAGVDERVRLVAQVCEALDYLHNQAIIHRDIKPSNILVTADGRVKLVDFGIAKVQTVEGLLGSASSLGRPTMILTPGYASPEQIEGRDVGKSADIYSVGVILYQLLTDKLPFTDEEGRPAVVAQLTGRDPEPPSKRVLEARKRTTSQTTESRRRITPDLDRIVLTALQKEPSRRYANVRLLADDLRRLLDGRPIVARADSWTYTFRKLVARNRLVAALVALLVVATAAGAWLIVRTVVDRTQVQAQQAELERIVALLNTNVERWADDAAAVPIEQRLADVQGANQLMASDTLRAVSASRDVDPERLKRLLDAMTRFLDRADDLSRDEAALRKEIAAVYLQVGDFGTTPAAVRAAGRQQAVTSYQRAARIAASVGTADPGWVDARLSEVALRLQQLGSVLDPAVLAAQSARVAPAPPPVVDVPEPPAATPAPPRARPQPPPVADATDGPELDELITRLRTTTASAELARRNLDVLRDRLAGQGQTIRSEVTTSMAMAEALLQQAAVDLARKDATAAGDSLRRAAYELRKVFQAVGR